MKIRIVARIDFRHKGVKYEKGSYYSVDESVATHTCKAGWAVDTTGRIKSEPLQVGKEQVVKPDDSRLDHRAIFNRAIKPVSKNG